MNIKKMNDIKITKLYFAFGKLIAKHQIFRPIVLRERTWIPLVTCICAIELQGSSVGYRKPKAVLLTEITVRFLLQK